MCTICSLIIAWLDIMTFAHRASAMESPQNGLLPLQSITPPEDSPFHAILGSWNNKKKTLLCDIKSERKKIHDAIKAVAAGAFDNLGLLPICAEAIRLRYLLKSVDYRMPESGIPPEELNEYAQSLGRIAEPLLPIEFDLIARINGITIHVYLPNSKGSDETCILNPGKRIVVAVFFNGIDRYERACISRENIKLCLPAFPYFSPKEIDQILSLLDTLFAHEAIPHIEELAAIPSLSFDQLYTFLIQPNAIKHLRDLDKNGFNLLINWHMPPIPFLLILLDDKFVKLIHEKIRTSTMHEKIKEALLKEITYISMKIYYLDSLALSTPSKEQKEAHSQLHLNLFAFSKQDRQTVNQRQKSTDAPRNGSKKRSKKQQEAQEKRPRVTIELEKQQQSSTIFNLPSLPEPSTPLQFLIPFDAEMDSWLDSFSLEDTIDPSEDKVSNLSTLHPITSLDVEPMHFTDVKTAVSPVIEPSDSIAILSSEPLPSQPNFLTPEEIKMGPPETKNKKKTNSNKKRKKRKIHDEEKKGRPPIIVPDNPSDELPAFLAPPSFNSILPQSIMSFNPADLMLPLDDLLSNQQDDKRAIEEQSLQSTQSSEPDSVASASEAIASWLQLHGFKEKHIQLIIPTIIGIEDHEKCKKDILLLIANKFSHNNIAQLINRTYKNINAIVKYLNDYQVEYKLDPRPAWVLSNTQLFTCVHKGGGGYKNFEALVYYLEKHKEEYNTIPEKLLSIDRLIEIVSQNKSLRQRNSKKVNDIILDLEQHQSAHRKQFNLLREQKINIIEEKNQVDELTTPTEIIMQPVLTIPSINIQPILTTMPTEEKKALVVTREKGLSIQSLEIKALELSCKKIKSWLKKSKFDTEQSKIIISKIKDYNLDECQKNINLLLENKFSHEDIVILFRFTYENIKAIAKYINSHQAEYTFDPRPIGLLSNEQLFKIVNRDGGSYNLEAIDSYLKKYKKAYDQKPHPMWLLTVDQMVKIVSHNGGSHNLKAINEYLQKNKKSYNQKEHPIWLLSLDQLIKIVNHDGGSQNLAAILQYLENYKDIYKERQRPAWILSLDQLTRIVNHDGGSKNLNAITIFLETHKEMYNTTSSPIDLLSINQLIKIVSHKGGANNLATALHYLEQEEHQKAYNIISRPPWILSVDQLIKIVTNPGRSQHLFAITSYLEKEEHKKAYHENPPPVWLLSASQLIVIGNNKNGGSRNINFLLEHENAIKEYNIPSQLLVYVLKLGEKGREALMREISKIKIPSHCILANNFLKKLCSTGDLNKEGLSCSTTIKDLIQEIENWLSTLPKQNSAPISISSNPYQLWHSAPPVSDGLLESDMVAQASSQNSSREEIPHILA